MEESRTITVYSYDEALKEAEKLLLFSEVLVMIREGKQGVDDFLTVYIKDPYQVILFTRYEVVVNKQHNLD